MNLAPSSRAARRNVQHTRQLKQQARPRTPAVPPPVELETLEPIHRRAAGSDLGSAENYVAVPSEVVAAGGAAM